MVLVASAPPAAAAESGPWATGVRLKERLAAPLTVSWDNAPLSRALIGLSKSQHVAIVRDRRIDPEQPLELAIDGVPLAEALATIARHLNIGYSQLGPVAYFGPRETAERLRTLAALRLEDARRLPATTTRKFLLMRNWQWNELTQPRELVSLLAEEVGAELVHADRIPHDLWPEADLPPLSWIDRLTLVAAQFDLTFGIENDGRRVRLVSVPDDVVLSRTYLGGRSAGNLARQWARALPAAKIKALGDRIQVAGRLEEHELLEARLRGKPARRTTVTAGAETYQLAVENAALDKVVDQLARRLGLEIQWDRAATEAAGIAADQLVSAKVEGASLEELLEAVFAGTGLAFRLTGRSVAIRPR